MTIAIQAFITIGTKSLPDNQLNNNHATKQIWFTRMPIVIILLFLIDALVVMVYLLDVAIGQPHHSLTRFVNLNEEGNLPTWHSAYQLSLIGFLLATNAYLYHRQRQKLPWMLMIGAFVFTLLSLDEVAQIHERVGAISDRVLPHGTREASIFSRTGIWMFLFAPPAILFCIWWAKSMVYYVHRTKFVISMLVVGMMIFIGGATVPELLFNWGTSKWWLTSLITLEEGCEMIGVTIIVWACYINLQDEFNAKH